MEVPPYSNKYRSFFFSDRHNNENKNYGHFFSDRQQCNNLIPQKLRNSDREIIIIIKTDGK
jgi:hypothetical protein